MEFRESDILRTSIRKLMPFIIIFSFYLFSYGPNFPGGGFQAGVVFGTIVVVMEISFGKEIYPDRVYFLIELTGTALLILSLLYSFLRTGVFFGGLYGFRTDSVILSNVYYWVFNLAIYLEVLASIILIFRNFLEWEHEEE